MHNFKKNTLLQMYALNYILAFFVWLGSYTSLNKDTWLSLLLAINVMYCALWGFWTVKKYYKQIRNVLYGKALSISKKWE